MVILYRGSRMQNLEYRLWHRKRIRFIGMPNILADRPVFPEFLQEQATPEALARAALTWLDNPQQAAEARRELAVIATMLGEPGALQRSAQTVLSWADRSSAAPTLPG